MSELVCNLMLCSSRKNPYPPQGRSSEIPRGRGVLKVKILEAKYEGKLEFPGGMAGTKQKTFHGRSMDIFWNCTLKGKFYRRQVNVLIDCVVFLFQRLLSMPAPLHHCRWVKQCHKSPRTWTPIHTEFPSESVLESHRTYTPLHL